MRTSAWFHLAVLLVLAPVFLLVRTVVHGLPFADALGNAPAELYVWLPVMGGLAIGMLRPERRSVSTAAQVVIVVTILMVALDLAGRDSASSVTRSLEALGFGGWERTGDLLRRYPANHPRVLAENIFNRGGLLLMPLVLTGIVLGVGAWIAQRVIFRSPTDESIARWAVAWVTVIGVFVVVVAWSGGYSYRILFHGEPLWLPLLPYVPALALAAVGWRAARLSPHASSSTHGSRDVESVDDGA